MARICNEIVRNQGFGGRFEMGGFFHRGVEWWKRGRSRTKKSTLRQTGCSLCGISPGGGKAGKTKETPCGCLFLLAERRGFEPLVGY